MSEDIDLPESVNLEIVADRLEFLEYLDGVCQYKPRIVEELGHSRSTVDRAIRALESEGLIERTDGGFTTTLKGRLLAEQYRETVSKSIDVHDAGDALSPLPSTVDITPAVVSGAEVRIAEGPLPKDPLVKLESAIEEATRLFGILPTITDRRTLDRYEDAIIDDGVMTEFVLAPRLVDSLRNRFEDRIRSMVVEGNLGLFSTETPEFGLILTETAGQFSTSVIVYDGEQSIHAVIRNDSLSAVQWGKDIYRQYREGATAVADQFVSDAEVTPLSLSLNNIEPPRSSTSTAQVSKSPTGASSTSLPEWSRFRLADEGFVELSSDYLDKRSVESPLTCWRTGLSLADVRAGYAIDRKRPADGGHRESVVEDVIGRLLDGEDCAVVDAPGSGKSTLCKTIAVRWHERGHGTVLYRESGAGGDFESLRLLEQTLPEVSGRVLVVVEDVLREGAKSILDAMETLRDDDSVVFLVDARQREWSDPDVNIEKPRAESYRREGITKISMPPLDRHEVERFIAHFDDLVDTDVSPSPDELYDAVIQETEPDEQSPAAILHLIHRLSVLADPLIATKMRVPTSLSEHMVQTYRHLRENENELTLDLAVIVNLLNLSGTDPYPELLYAVALSSEQNGMRSAIDELKRRFLLHEEVSVSGGQSRYQTVHESWSRAFLREFLDQEGEGRARQRVRRCLSNILQLADDEDLRDEVRWQVAGQTTYLDQITSSPEEWTESFLLSIFDLSQRFPKILPVLGEAGSLGVRLPSACSSSVAAEALLQRAVTEPGHLERGLADAEAAEKIATDRIEDDTEAARYRARALYTQSQILLFLMRHNDAELKAKEAVEIAEKHGFDRIAPKARTTASITAHPSELLSANRQAVEEFKQQGRHQERLDTFSTLLQMEIGQHDYEAAIETAREKNELARELSNKRAEREIKAIVADDSVHVYLNCVKQGPLEAGLGFSDQEWEREAELIARFMGYEDHSFQSTISMLREVTEDAIELAERTGSDIGKVLTADLSYIAIQQGNLDRAMRLLETVSFDDPVRKPVPTILEAMINHRRSKSDRVSDLLDEVLRWIDDIDGFESPVPSINIAFQLSLAAVVANNDGDRERARKFYDHAIETLPENYPYIKSITTLERLLPLSRIYDGEEMAHELCDRIDRLSAEMTNFEGKRQAVQRYRSQELELPASPEE